MVNLLNSHIIIDSNIAGSLFDNESYVQVVYYLKNGVLMIARDSDELFKKLHKASPVLLKNKNIQGDKSLNLREIIIDNDLDDSDRPLLFSEDKIMNVLSIYFNV